MSAAKRKVYNAVLAIERQKALCERLEMPMFAPSDGRCPVCGRGVFDAGGISVENAGESAVTACPWCSVSFIE